MFKFIHDKANKRIEYSGLIKDYADEVILNNVLSSIVKQVSQRYVEENYDEIIKLVDVDAFKANLIIALTVEAASKARRTL